MNKGRQQSYLGREWARDSQVRADWRAQLEARAEAAARAQQYEVPYDPNFPPARVRSDEPKLLHVAIAAAAILGLLAAVGWALYFGKILS